MSEKEILPLKVIILTEKYYWSLLKLEASSADLPPTSEVGQLNGLSLYLGSLTSPINTHAALLTFLLPCDHSEGMQIGDQQGYLPEDNRNRRHGHNPYGVEV